MIDENRVPLAAAFLTVRGAVAAHMNFVAVVRYGLHFFVQLAQNAENRQPLMQV